MLFFVFLFLTLLAVTADEFESFPIPELREVRWTNSRPCAKQLFIAWLYPEGVRGLKRFYIKNTFYVWSEEGNEGVWREESLLVKMATRSLTLKNNHLGNANKLSVCGESYTGRIECSRNVYIKVPAKQFGTIQVERCREKSFSVPPDLTSVRIVDIQFPSLEEEVMGGVSVKWVFKGELRYTKGFVVKTRSREGSEWKEISKRVSLETKQFVLHGFNYSVAHYVSVCGDEKRERTPEICSKQEEIQFQDPVHKSGYIGPTLSPQPEPKMVPINTFGSYTTERKVGIHWRFPFASKGTEFEVGLFSNCAYPSALRSEKRVRVSSSETRVEVLVSGGMKPLCARVCIVSAGAKAGNGKCGMLVPIVPEVVTPPRVMSLAGFVRVSLQASQTRDTSTFLLISVDLGQLEVGGSLSVTCWGRHTYKGRLGGSMVRRVVQSYAHKLKSGRENSLRLTGLLTDMEYKCALDGQVGDRIVISTNDAVFKTIMGRPTPPPPPQLIGDTHVTDRGTVTRSFSLYVSPSSEREGVPEFYDLAAVPLAMYTDQFGREMYKSEFAINTIQPQYKDPLGKIPSSIHHPLIARRTNSPVPFQVYRLDHLILPLNISFDTPLDTKLWKRGVKYSFLLLAFSYSGVNGSLVFSRSEVSLPVSISRRHGGSSTPEDTEETPYDPSDPMGVVGEYMDKAFDMTLGQLPAEHHMWVGTLAALLGYILAAILALSLLLVSVLYVRLKMSVRKGSVEVKPKGNKVSVPKEKGESIPMLAAGRDRGMMQSDEESFYYENTTFLRNIDATSESEYTLSSAVNSPTITPQHQLISPLKQPCHQDTGPTLSPAAHQLSQSRHQSPNATQDTKTQQIQ